MLDNAGHIQPAATTNSPCRKLSFPQLREALRENAFLGLLREAAGKTAGKSILPHGKTAVALREYREMPGQ
ncbi:hypothetical protein ACVWZA_003100 [Sphingomonas sp. UYAg733]